MNFSWIFSNNVFTRVWIFIEVEEEEEVLEEDEEEEGEREDIWCKMKRKKDLKKNVDA